MNNEKMQRVTRAEPCPICGKPDWCLVAPDGSAAICQRIEEGSVKKCGDAGHLHVLADRHNGHNRHEFCVRPRQLLKSGLGRNGCRDFAELARRYQGQLTRDRLGTLAQSLGISPRSLQRLRGGWDGRAYTFPMLDASDEVVGIRRRFPEGKKASVRGSKNGLFIPTDPSNDGPLLICEGPTDTTAALDLGFDAIGRPNCNSLIEMTVKVVKGRTEIVIVADRDAVGIAGATRLANVIALHCPSVKIIQPPDGIKDLRQWRNVGLTSDALQGVIAATGAICIKVRFSWSNADRRAWS
jgi:hypothetical protein